MPAIYKLGRTIFYEKQFMNLIIVSTENNVEFGTVKNLFSTVVVFIDTS